ncbi:hypothetical protein LSH36_132g02013 [Paralvinella palmiformis]|uniref:H/ACA ribonucleoprotein complex subunit n=1 Tax=Paralvinella palmiformis TaxID=53620 RepID=A0AAD9JW13_9ANNE|nr:hypothetical protein LSH36_132g02013 [Paralvinella palmiformis]
MENNDTIKCTEIIPTELDSSRLTVLATQKTEDMELNGVMVPCLRVDDKINTQEQTEGDIKTKLTDEIPEVKMILKGENHISSLTTDKETNLEKDYFTELEMKNNFMETENGAQAIEGSSNIKQHCSHVVELDTSNKGENSVTSHRKVNEESKLEADEAVQMNYRGNEPSLAKSDTSSDSSEDESSSESRGTQPGCKSILMDLPPIEELAITVGDDVKMVEVGKITSAIHTLVIVQAKADLPPLNEDTVLFLEERKVLGQVFETFGPVSTPLYSVRFNSPDQINERQLRPGLIVFYVPDAPEYTHYVFMAHLQRLVCMFDHWY